MPVSPGNGQRRERAKASILGEHGEADPTANTRFASSARARESPRFQGLGRVSALSPLASGDRRRCAIEERRAEALLKPPGRGSGWWWSTSMRLGGRRNLSRACTARKMRNPPNHASYLHNGLKFIPSARGRGRAARSRLGSPWPAADQYPPDEQRRRMDSSAFGQQVAMRPLSNWVCEAVSCPRATRAEVARERHSVTRGGGRIKQRTRGRRRHNATMLEAAEATRVRFTSQLTFRVRTAKISIFPTNLRRRGLDAHDHALTGPARVVAEMKRVLKGGTLRVRGMDEPAKNPLLRRPYTVGQLCAASTRSNAPGPFSLARGELPPAGGGGAFPDARGETPVRGPLDSLPEWETSEMMGSDDGRELAARRVASARVLRDALSRPRRQPRAPDGHTAYRERTKYFGDTILAGRSSAAVEHRKAAPPPLVSPFAPVNARALTPSSK